MTLFIDLQKKVSTAKAKTFHKLSKFKEQTIETSKDVYRPKLNRNSGRFGRFMTTRNIKRVDGYEAVNDLKHCFLLTPKTIWVIQLFPIGIKYDG